MGNTSSKDGDYEIIIKNPVKDISKHFLQQNLIIWHEPNPHSIENSSYAKNLQNIGNLRIFTNSNEASDFIKANETPSCVITSGTDGEKLATEISGCNWVSAIYVFCMKVEYHTQWASKFDKVKGVENSFKKIEQEIIKWERQCCTLRRDFPVFAPIFDDWDKSNKRYLGLYLEGLVNFRNRKEGKKDFLSLARSVYRQDQLIECFERDYKKYDMRKILNWYTRQCFVYKLTNNCLRIATSDSIQYCRLILKDLQIAIQQQYRITSRNFSGLLYRGAFLSSEEWDRIQENCGKDIEMYGFLSTSKKKSVAIEFIGTLTSKKALITIIVPPAMESEGQGFAEMRDFSSFPEEEEVLFNVQSRFTILGANIEDINGVSCRHLVLLYGRYEMKKAISKRNPSIKIKIEKFEQARCGYCDRKVQDIERSVAFVDLENQEDYMCYDCFRKDDARNSWALVCVSLDAIRGKITNGYIKVRGLVLKYKERLGIPFYGYKCKGCENLNMKSSLVCRNCRKLDKGWCNLCFNEKNGCIADGHVIVVEQHPFVFWSEKLGKHEAIEHKTHAADQGEMFIETHDNEKARQYYEKCLKEQRNLSRATRSQYLDKLGEIHDALGEFQIARDYYLNALNIKRDIYRKKDLNIAISYNSLGNVYSNLGEYQKAIDYHLNAVEVWDKTYGSNHPYMATSYNNIANVQSNFGEYQKAREYHSRALEIRKAYYGEKHEDTSSSYNNMGVAYLNLGEYQEAIKYYSIALEIRKTNFGDKHPDTAISFNNLGEAYHRLGEYQKAREYYSSALKAWISIYGDKHSDTAIGYSNLGNLEYKLGEVETAREYHLTAMEAWRSAHGDQHPQTAISYNNLGNLYECVGEYEKARECHFKALEIWEAKRKDKHPNIAVSCHNIGSVYCSEGEYVKAREYCEKAVEKKKEIYGEKHAVVGSSWNNIGVICCYLREYEKAKESMVNAIAIFREVYGEKHLDVGISYYNLGEIYTQLGEYEKAAECSSLAIEIMKAFSYKNSCSVKGNDNLKLIQDEL